MYRIAAQAASQEWLGMGAMGWGSGYKGSQVQFQGELNFGGEVSVKNEIG